MMKALDLSNNKAVTLNTSNHFSAPVSCQQCTTPSFIFKANKASAKNERDQEWISHVKSLILEELQESRKPSVEDLAKLVFLSARQLHRKIKAITGLTTAKFVRELQLESARIELETTNVISITDVAYNNGFEYTSTFCTLFKKRFGISPNVYRKHG